jgi:hypothetical protein
MKLSFPLLAKCFLAAGLATGALVTTPGSALAYQVAPCDPSGATANDASLATRLNSTLHTKMRGYMDAYRVSCARKVVEAVKGRRLDSRAAVIAITTVIVESGIQNISEKVDHTSLGLFQQLDQWGSAANRLNPTWATNAFLDKMLRVYPNNSWMTTPIGTVCQGVQQSQYPSRYPPEVGDAQLIVGALWSDGGSVLPSMPSISVGDLDNDGIIDLTGLKPNGDVYFDRNTGAGNGVSWGGGFLADGVSSYVQIAVGDLNNDGKNDLIGLTADSDVYFNLNTGVGNGVTWGGSWLAVGSSGYTGIDVGDLNNDGTVDLAGRRADGNVYLNPNIGTNSDNGITWGTEIPVFEGAHYTNISVGDLNNDGVIDLAGRKADGNIYISINTGAGNGVTWRETFKAVGGQSLDTFDIGDLDNDGLNDITARTADHSIWLYPNNGTGNGISWDKQRLVYGTSPY